MYRTAGRSILRRLRSRLRLSEHLKKAEVKVERHEVQVKAKIGSNEPDISQPLPPPSCSTSAFSACSRLQPSPLQPPAFLPRPQP